MLLWNVSELWTKHTEYGGSSCSGEEVEVPIDSAGEGIANQVENDRRVGEKIGNQELCSIGVSRVGLEESGE